MEAAVAKIRSIFLGTQEKRIIAENTAWLTVAEAITRLSKFALIVYATRILGPTGFGQFSFALSFVMIFTVFADLGLSQIISREISQRKKGELEFNNILSLKIIISFIVLLAVVIIAQITISDLLVRQSVLILLVFMFTNTISDFLFSFFQARKNMRYEAYTRIIQAVASTILGFLLLSQTQTTVGLTISYALAGLISLIYISILYFLKRRKSSSVKTRWLQFQTWKKYLMMSWPLILTGIFAMIYNEIDSVMMGYYGQIKEVGLYNASYRAMWVILVPCLLIYRTFFPIINENYFKSTETYKRIWKYYLRISLFMAVPTLLFGILLANQIIIFVFGPDYSGAVTSFQVLIGVAGLTLLSFPFNQGLIAANKQKKVFFATFWGALINIILNLVLIPRYSLNGAALATLIAVSVVLLLQGAYYLKIDKVQRGLV